MSSLKLGHLMLLASICLGAVGHTLLKHLVGSADIARLRVTDVALLGKALAVLLLLALSFGAWVWALRHLDLSYAYAVASASIVVVAVLASAFLGEPVGARAWLGLLLIVIGCVLVAPAYART